MTTVFRRGMTALTAIAIVVLGTIVAGAPASSAAQPTTPSMTNIRTGLNSGFDRIVLDMTGQVQDVVWGFTDELTEDPTGDIVWLTGERFVWVTVIGATMHDQAGNPTYPGPRKFRTRNLSNVMAVATTGDFEATLGIGLGLRNQTWVRVSTLTGPNRVVIDVGH
ncbi:MAG TPA: hypothetical protein VFV67_31555 [Actinophytocola sp.]|uniref:AMIN-like domain-containing (lipo)protein n=1 Tax=Actinophytocola sp. TaxID=1872138 RepID=UPI002DB99F4F|nr:hypothetical protein [Actinophytocola sp.]HEU5475203.1 hypothetical protein [Actinophytocola sp.]